MTLKENLKRISQLKHEAEDARTRIQSDKTRNDAWKKDALARIDADLREQLNAFSDEVQEQLQSFRAAVDNKRPVYDVLNHKFVNALSVIQNAGGRLTPELQKQLVQQFKNDALALRTIMPLMSDCGLKDGAFEASELLQTMNSAETNFAALADSVYFSMQRVTESEGEVERFIQTLDSYAATGGENATV